MARGRPRDLLRPGQIAPLFVLTALIHAGAVVTRFDVVHAALPSAVHAAILCAQLPLLLIGGYYESRIDHAATPGFPLWMQIRSRPVKWSLTLAFTYFALVVAQALDLEFGSFDPSPPLAWPTPQRALWFGMFTFGMFFANYLATASVLIPLLRLVSRPFRLLPPALALILLAAGGLGLGLFALDAGRRHGAVLDDHRALLDDPHVGVGVMLAVTLVPLFVGALADRFARGPDKPRDSAG